MLALRQAVTCFRRGRKTSLELERHALEQGLTIVWCGQPDPRSRRLPIVASMVGAVLMLLLFVADGMRIYALATFALLLALLLPFIVIMDWAECEYLVTTTHVHIKHGALVREPTVHALDQFNWARIVPRRGPGRSHLVDLEFCNVEADPNDPEVLRMRRPPLRLCFVPSERAKHIIDTLSSEAATPAPVAANG